MSKFGLKTGFDKTYYSVLSYVLRLMKFYAPGRPIPFKIT
jgi:hypothetical protein